MQYQLELGMQCQEPSPSLAKRIQQIGRRDREKQKEQSKVQMAPIQAISTQPTTPQVGKEVIEGDMKNVQNLERVQRR